MKDTRDQSNKKIDELLQKRQDGILNYARATNELIKMGVKITNKGTGDIRVPFSFQKYIDKYNKSNMEFEWEVEYYDGSILKQFDPEEHNFRHIEKRIQDVKYVRFISNFDWPTANSEKRAIIQLDIESGEFSFVNGFISQEDRGELLKAIKPQEEKQLILFTRKRVSETSGDFDDEYKEFIQPMNEIFNYNRFVLGYKIPKTGEKYMVMIYPNGEIKLFNG